MVLLPELLPASQTWSHQTWLLALQLARTACLGSRQERATLDMLEGQLTAYCKVGALAGQAGHTCWPGM